MKYILVFMLSHLLLSCQLFKKNDQKFSEDSFFDEEVAMSDQEENIEETFEVMENSQQVKEINEETIKNEEEFVEVQDKIFFDFNSSSISEEGRKVADLQYLWLKENPNINITIEGHCDERGTREYNISLGAKRADALKKYFINRGISQSRINVISFGEEKPYLIGAGQEIWKKNRRAVVVER
jgi:peptidoglycan-associated lipoprotein